MVDGVEVEQVRVRVREPAAREPEAAEAEQQRAAEHGIAGRAVEEGVALAEAVDVLEGHGDGPDDGGTGVEELVEEEDAGLGGKGAEARVEKVLVGLAGKG